jgi:hypothetical protein
MHLPTFHHSLRYIHINCASVHFVFVDSHLHGLLEFLKVETLHPDFARSGKCRGTAAFATAAARAALAIRCNSKAHTRVVGQNGTAVNYDYLICIQFLRDHST